MPKLSAGLVMYRERRGQLEVLLVHPGGPFWAKKDLGAWSLPKGEVGPEEYGLVAARREFEEETGIRPSGEIISLRKVTQKGGKTVEAWAFQGDCDPRTFRSNTFTMEWPSRSGKRSEFPEVDRAEFFAIDAAKRQINLAQVALLEKLEQIVSRRSTVGRGGGG
jgi:predicted NUDIX family NTP pyrophosphohydrolase